jgi:hypothetical protein
VICIPLQINSFSYQYRYPEIKQECPTYEASPYVHATNINVTKGTSETKHI